MLDIGNESVVVIRLMDETHGGLDRNVGAAPAD